MNKFLIKTIALISLFCSFFCLASGEVTYFEALPHTAVHQYNISPMDVYYFFNLNCHSCRDFSPYITDWSKKNTKKINFIEMPIAPFSSWEWGVKAYLAAKEINPKVTRNDLEIAQKKAKINLITDILRAADVVSYATNYNRSKIMILLSSARLDKKLKHIKKLAKSFNVTGVPNLVLIGKNINYRISPEFKLTYKGMINVLNGTTSFQEHLLSNKKKVILNVKS